MSSEKAKENSLIVALGSVAQALIIGMVIEMYWIACLDKRKKQWHNSMIEELC